MLFFITNKNPDVSFPGVLKSGMDMYLDRDDNGAMQGVVEITSITDLLSLDSACHVCNEWYTGMTLEGNRITLNEGHKYET